MSVVEKLLALKKLTLLIHYIAKKTYSKVKVKIQGKILQLGQTKFLKNRMKKDNFYKSFRLRSNNSTLLIQHDLLCGTDNLFQC